MLLGGVGCCWVVLDVAGWCWVAEINCKEKEKKKEIINKLPVCHYGLQFILCQCLWCFGVPCVWLPPTTTTTPHTLLVMLPPLRPWLYVAILVVKVAVRCEWCGVGANLVVPALFAQCMCVFGGEGKCQMSLNTVVSVGCHWMPLDVTGCCWVLLDVTGCFGCVGGYCPLPDATG